MARHRVNKDNLIIKTKEPIVIYRIVENNKYSLRHNYIKTDIPVYVHGMSVSHTMIVKKTFKPGIIEFSSGSNKSSSPILIGTVANSSEPNDFFEVYNKFSLFEVLFEKYIK